MGSQVTYLDILKAQLIGDEGREKKMYKDTAGVLTIGIGHNMNNPISDAAVDQIFSDDVAPIDAQCRTMFSNFDAMTDPRKAVLANMMFQLGPTRLATFTVFVGLVVHGQFNAAADDMLTTLWAKQVPSRAKRLADAMRAG